MGKQKYRIRNWSEYNKSLVQRGSIKVWLSESVLNNWHYTGNRKPEGKQSYTGLAIETALIIRIVYTTTTHAKALL